MKGTYSFLVQKSGESTDKYATVLQKANNFEI